MKIASNFLALVCVASPADTMQRTTGYLAALYGGIEGYLKVGKHCIHVRLPCGEHYAAHMCGYLKMRSAAASWATHSSVNPSLRIELSNSHPPPTDTSAPLAV